MSTEIFQKEAEFHKLNLELEMRTQALIDEVDLVIKNQQQCEVKSRGTTNPSFSGTIFPEIYQNEDDYLYDKSYASTPASSQIQQNFAKFLKQKMKKMQDEVKQLQTDYKRKCDVVRKLQCDNKSLEEERTKLQQQLQIVSEQTARQDIEITTLSKRFTIKETESSCLRREIDALKKDLRNQSSTSSSNEIKLNRTLEEVERLKATIKELRSEAKELRETGSKEIQEIRIKNKRLENQKADLTNAVKKQSLLIDNLKKQKMHLEASRLLNITEDEFIKILDWSMADKRDTGAIQEGSKNSKTKVNITRKNGAEPALNNSTVELKEILNDPTAEESPEIDLQDSAIMRHTNLSVN